MISATQIDSNDVKFRQGIFNLLNTLKQNSDETYFNNIIEVLQEKLNNVPTNDLEESKRFFYEITNVILTKLEDFYQINHIEIENDIFHANSFKFIPIDETKEMLDTYNKCKGMKAFNQSFLNSYDYELWELLNRNQYGRLFEQCTQDNDDNYLLTRNKISLEGPVFLPKDSYGKYMGVSGNGWYLRNLANTVSTEHRFLGNLKEKYQSLIAAVDEFNQKLKRSLHEEHLRFGIKCLKEMLAKIIVPVSLIENEQLRQICEDQGRTVFIKTPTFDDLLYIGCSVHVYSSFNMDDDSSYIAKPIVISEQLPTDTDELKYLGVGQYTNYDDQSTRSLNGANPYVINNNVFVKANYEDFKAIIPQELLEDMRICENLVDSMENPVDCVRIEESEMLQQIIKSIKADNSLDPDKIIKQFITCSEQFENMEEQEMSPVFIKEPLFEFKLTHFNVNDSLLNKNAKHPFGYVLLKDHNNNYAALRVCESRSREMYLSKTSLDDCIRALQLPKGLYSVYDFSKRDLSKQEALVSIHPYTE